EPFSKKGNSLWQVYGYGWHEYGLGAVEVRPDEDLIIEITVTTPDPQLARGNPRLKLVGDHDFAGLGLQYFVIATLRDSGLVLSLILLVGLVCLAWARRDLQRPIETPISTSAD